MNKNKLNYHDYYPTNVFMQNGHFKVANPLVVSFSGYQLTYLSIFYVMQEKDLVFCRRS